jgi:hypothetical protein
LTSVVEPEKTKEAVKTFTSPLTQCSEPNQRIYIDLLRPLKTMPSSKKIILCVAGAFLKYLELVAIPDKSPPAVGFALFSR